LSVAGVRSRPPSLSIAASAARPQPFRRSVSSSDASAATAPIFVDVSGGITGAALASTSLARNASIRSAVIFPRAFMGSPFVVAAALATRDSGIIGGSCG